MKKSGGGGGGQGECVQRMGGQCGCERRSEAFVKIPKKIGEGGGVGLGDQGGCKRRSVFVKIRKKYSFLGWGPIRGWDGGGVCKVWGRWKMWGMGDVNQE